MFELAPHTIYLCLAGSRAHGTARAGSDVDVRGVCIAPLEVRLSLFTSFEQYEGALPEAFTELAPKVSAPKVECAIFDVAKMLRLCANANPNALEILFTDERDWLLATEAWRRVHDARQQFLTQRVEQTFVGYAMAQLQRIHGKRARGIEREHGYDTKQAAHLVRLLRMGLEIVRDGQVQVRRPDAAELIAIRDGALPFDGLLAHADALRADIARAVASSRLPLDVDRTAVDRLAFELVRSGPGPSAR